MKTVTLSHSTPERLDVALAAALGISRAKVQKMIKDGDVQVDGLPATAHTSVSNTRQITITETSQQTTDAERAPISLDILYEDTDVLVVNKPAGLLVHPTESSRESTLLDAVLAHDPAIAKVGDDRSRAGIVHRLDKDASGVLIIAKNNAAFRHLKTQFAERQTTKRYTVLVMGRLADDHGTITFPIARSRTRARMAARPLSQEGKEAITHFDVRERFANATLLDVCIETGRTHQIRAHFFALGFPVAGDTLYIRKGVKQLNLDRLFLHARDLTIALPNGETRSFTAPLPESLVSALGTLSRLPL